jgi:uncharacterized protein
MNRLDSIPNAVTRRLGYYVYLLVDPRNNEPFYVGKGKGKRALAHGSEDANEDKAGRIAQLNAMKRPHRIDILVHGIREEETAFRIEAAVIDLLGPKHLTNLIRGWDSVAHGRRSLNELIAHYSRQEVKIKEPAVLIRINRLYRSEMSATELYDATRGVWRIGDKRESVKYAFAVYDSIIREVYRIAGWYPAGSTMSTREVEDLKDPERWEFVGTLAEPRIRNKYLNKAVEPKQFPVGAQNPIKYVNV